MSAVLDLARLILQISLGILYFTGLGWLVTDLLFHRDSADDRENVPPMQRIPLAITLGFIVNYGVSLLVQSLFTGLIIGAVISIIGLWRLAGYFLRRTNRDNKSPIHWIGIVFLCLLYLIPVLFDPLTEWDARSIWFFHAKMIHAAGSFGASAGWQHPSVIFSHVDYPNLVPGIAAQTTYMLGYWNEYIPKISLFFILVPAVMWLFTFADRSFSFVALVVIFPFSMSVLIWNGYMDGYVSLYLSVAMLLLGRYIQQARRIDLISAIICLTLLLYLKNEGQLATLIGVLSVLVAGFLTKKSGRVRFELRIPGWQNLVAAAIVLSPFVLWSAYKLNLDLSNDLQIGSAQSVTRIVERIGDGSYGIISSLTFEHVEGALLLLGLLFLAAIAQERPIPRTVVPALATAAMYYAGIQVVYLLTPNDLEWHLYASAGRTMLPVAGCVFVACYFVLDTLERLAGINQVETS